MKYTYSEAGRVIDVGTQLCSKSSASWVPTGEVGIPPEYHLDMTKNIKIVEHA